MMQEEDDSKPGILSPFSIGKRFDLSHRVVLAPLTRCRALNHVPQPAHVLYYSQRASKGGLLISEAVVISPEGIGFPNTPGIFTEEQVEGWKKVVEAVHEKGAFFFCQLWHVGRASHSVYQPEGKPPISSTNRPIEDGSTILMPDGASVPYSAPRALETDELPLIVDQFRSAARNAVRAGFDGVEIHSAHGYLLDQFLKDGINDRADDYGGSIENRCKFPLEVLQAVADEIGSDRAAIRLSPILDYIGAKDSDPVTLMLHMVDQLNQRFEPGLAYLHVTELRFTTEVIKEESEMEEEESEMEEESGQPGQDLTEKQRRKQVCRLMRERFNGAFMSSGGFDEEKAVTAVRNGWADLISFGRLFISNPDLPLRFALKVKLTKYDRSTFYTSDQVVGYNDYPTYNSPRQANFPCFSFNGNRKDNGTVSN